MSSVGLSVCLSVTLVDCDRIGWNSSEIISPLVSLGCLLSADPNVMDLLQGEHPEILVQSDPPSDGLSVGDIRSQIAAEWLQIAQRSQWRAYRKPPSLFRMVPSLTPYDLTFPQNGGSICPKIRKWPHLRNGWSDTPCFSSMVGFSGSVDRMALFPVTSNQSRRQAAILDNFEWPYLRNGSFDPLI